MTTFRTLSGFLQGEENNEPPYSCFSATLRIHGMNFDLDDVTTELGVLPTYSHRIGEPRKRGNVPWQDNAWHFSSSLPEEECLGSHISFIWDRLRSKKDILLSYKADRSVDLFLGYRSNCDHAGFSLPHESLHIFTELKIPIDVSVIII
jgi:hypothetical protein